MDMRLPGSTAATMTIRRDRAGRAFAATLLAIVGFLIVGAAVFWLRATPKREVSIRSPAAEIGMDPLRFTSTTTNKADMSEAELAAAVAINASIPIVSTARITARPFFFDPMLPPVERARAEYCLTQAIYYEAGAETLIGQRGVAQVVLNRVRHPLYPQTVCGVVFQGAERVTGCQFTFACDGALARVPSQAGWRRANAVAAAALAGYVESAVGTATHYHTDWVTPMWRTELVKIAQLGTHIFYRWPGRMGTPVAFAMRYRGGEVLGPGGAMLPVTDMTLLDGSSTIPTSAQVETSVPDGPSRQRPAPLAADTQRSDLRADEERGTLKASEQAATLQR